MGGVCKFFLAFLRAYLLSVPFRFKLIIIFQFLVALLHKSAVPLAVVTGFLTCVLHQTCMFSRFGLIGTYGQYSVFQFHSLYLAIIRFGPNVQFRAAVLVGLAIAAACSCWLWKRHHSFRHRSWSPEIVEDFTSSDRESSVSWYAPPRYRCSGSFVQALPPPYNEVCS